MLKKWFIILNPNSGKFNAEDKIEHLKKLLITNNSHLNLRLPDTKNTILSLRRMPYKKATENLSVLAVTVLYTIWSMR